ncbi:GNAT family N-acetyltransferase [Spongisporangium articulatum]|uniref:GNAT family N-acetyltransferase n=1 Tax=Spongisporangium articulatum TaxID=3362603 RepID=A0ABW8AMD8_9ACTN
MLPERAGRRRLTWHPLTPDLVPAWWELLGALRAADGGGRAFTAAELHDELRPAWARPEANSRIAMDDDGAARAFGLTQVRPGDHDLVRAWLWGGVHPDWCALGLGRSLLRWQLDRARALVAERRAELTGASSARVVPRAMAFTVAENESPGVQRLARRLGFEASRYFAGMRRDLGAATGPLPRPPVPAGVRLVPWRLDLDELVLAAHNEAFAEHWMFQPWPLASWRHWQTGHRTFRPAWSLVAVTGDGEVAGYVLNSEPGPAEGDPGPVGWTDKIGVRPAWRGRGLGRALLAGALSAFQAAGMVAAGLDVDVDNTTSAVRLYEELGYVVHDRAVQLTLAV